MSELNALRTIQQYQASRTSIFISMQSLWWFYRNNKRELIERGATMLITGRVMIHPNKFDAVVMAVGQRAAARRNGLTDESGAPSTLLNAQDGSPGADQESARIVTVSSPPLQTELEHFTVFSPTGRRQVPLPTRPGVYARFKEDAVQYVGRSANISARQNSHRKRIPCDEIRYFECDGLDARKLENYLIAKHNPPFNVIGRAVDARCVGCSCDDIALIDRRGVWLRVDYEQGRGVCDHCPQHEAQWDLDHPPQS